MLRWLSVALCLATSLAIFIEPSQQSNEPGDALSQCWGLAWVRAPDMAPGNVIAGDVRVKLIGPCTDAERYTLGLRYKERIFWRLKRQDAPLPELPTTVRYMGSGRPKYNEEEWMAYKSSLKNKDLWSVHEEERVSFEIKTDLVSANGGDPLPKNFTTRFGILVPNTNYPPGLDFRHGSNANYPPGLHYRHGSRAVTSMGDTDTILSESIYEYFVEVKFRNGTTSEMPAGITSFAPGPYNLPTENDASPVNVSLTPKVLGPNLQLDVLRSNYTVEVSFSGRAHVYQDSSAEITATQVHRTGYTNRTDTPIELCAFIGDDAIEWHPEEVNRSPPSPPCMQNIRALGPHMQLAHTYSSPMQFANTRSPPYQGLIFAAAGTHLTQESHVSSTSSESVSLSLCVNRWTVPDFSTYYQKLGHRIRLELRINPDPSEPWDNDFQKREWETNQHWQKITAGMDESDFDWVPWSRPPLITPRAPNRLLTGQFGISVLPMQRQPHVRSMPVHYLSDKARQPIFVDISDIHNLCLMSPEERDLIAPLAQPFINVFAEGEELGIRYFADFEINGPVYVGETWARKALPVIANGYHDGRLTSLRAHRLVRRLARLWGKTMKLRRVTSDFLWQGRQALRN